MVSILLKTGPARGQQTEKTRRSQFAVRKRAVTLPLDIVATDSEWDTTIPGDKWLSTTFATERATVICFRADLPRSLRTRLNAAALKQDVQLLYVRRNDATSLFGLAAPYLFDVEADDVRERFRLAFFFSAKDVEFALVWKQWGQAIQGGKVRQHTNIAGRVGSPGPGEIRLKDLVGWAAKTSLKNLARPGRGRAPLALRHVLTVAAALDWHEQRRRWRRLRGGPSSTSKLQCLDGGVLFRR